MDAKSSRRNFQISAFLCRFVSLDKPADASQQDVDQAEGTPNFNLSVTLVFLICGRAEENGTRTWPESFFKHVYNNIGCVLISVFFLSSKYVRNRLRPWQLDEFRALRTLEVRS